VTGMKTYRVWNIALEWTAQKIPVPTVTPLLHVTQPLPSSDCFSGSIFLALSKYARIQKRGRSEALFAVVLIILVTSFSCLSIVID
jgi:hypothetical protein